MSAPETPLERLRVAITEAENALADMDYDAHDRDTSAAIRNDISDAIVEVERLALQISGWDAHDLDRQEAE